MTPFGVIFCLHGLMLPQTQPFNSLRDVAENVWTGDILEIKVILFYRRKRVDSTELG